MEAMSKVIIGVGHTV